MTKIALIPGATPASAAFLATAPMLAQTALAMKAGPI